MNKSRFIYCKELSLYEVIFVYLSRVLFIVSAIFSKSTSETVFAVVSFLLTYLISFLHFISKENSFINNLSQKITVLISSSSVVSCFIGQTIGVLEKFPEYDIFMSAVTGVNALLFGYYLTTALNPINSKENVDFTVTSSLFISGTIVFFRDLFEFFSDYLFGTNFCHITDTDDNHWFFRIFGFGKGVPEQRPLYDFDEDILISLVVSALSAVFLYVFLRRKHKFFFSDNHKSKLSLKAIPQRTANKIYLETDKIKEQTNILDILCWWCTRATFVYALFNMEPSAERVKIIASILGTFAITFIHLIFPKNSIPCKTNYRIQTLISILCFFGIYPGSYMGVYNLLPRYDLFLHFISGPFCVYACYYIATIFLKPDNKKSIVLIVLYSFAFSGFVMPFWEVTEFLGDFLFGSANQGFYWAPTDDSFFFKIFGHGVGNNKLYCLFDTVYDVLLALVTTVISTIALWAKLICDLHKNKNNSHIMSNSKNRVVKC